MRQRMTSAALAPWVAGSLVVLVVAVMFMIVGPGPGPADGPSLSAALHSDNQVPGAAAIPVPPEAGTADPAVEQPPAGDAASQDRPPSELEPEDPSVTGPPPAGTTEPGQTATERTPRTAGTPTGRHATGPPIRGAPGPEESAPEESADGPAGPGPSATGPTTTTLAPTTTAPPPPIAPNAQTADLTSYGAKCDGTTNDRAALQRAVTDMVAKRGVVSVSGNCRILTTSTTASISLTGQVTIRGASAGATLSFDADQPGAFRKLFDVSGDNVSLENLTLRRVSDVYGVMLMLHGPANFTLSGVVVDGQKNIYSGNTFHGIAIWGDSGDLTNASILGTTIKNTDYALFQDSGVRTTTDGFTVDGSTFTGNRLDDLEFNSPSGRMVNVKVTNSRFSDNRAGAGQTGAGFGVGLANVQHVLIQGNSFDGYALDPVHIEDRSGFVTVDDNSFSNSFTAALNYASHVFVVSGSHDITVTGNTFDTSANSNRIDCVYLGPGGGAPITDVTVSGNTFRLRPNATAIGKYGVSNLRESENTTVRLP